MFFFLLLTVTTLTRHVSELHIPRYQALYAVEPLHVTRRIDFAVGKSTSWQVDLLPSKLTCEPWDSFRMLYVSFGQGSSYTLDPYAKAFM